MESFPDCVPAVYKAGEKTEVRLVGWSYVTATTRAGDPVSIVTTPDGRFYVGGIEPRIGCPCLLGR